MAVRAAQAAPLTLPRVTSACRYPLMALRGSPEEILLIVAVRASVPGTNGRDARFSYRQHDIQGRIMTADPATLLLQGMAIGTCVLCFALSAIALL